MRELGNVSNFRCSVLSSLWKKSGSSKRSLDFYKYSKRFVLLLIPEVSWLEKVKIAHFLCIIFFFFIQAVIKTHGLLSRINRSD